VAAADRGASTANSPGETASRPDIRDARLYLCTDGRQQRGDLAEFLDAVLSHGVDIIQLREKGLEARRELALLEQFAEACARHGKLLAVNDRADVAFAAGAAVLHLGQDDLPTPFARRVVGPGVVLGRSTHSEQQVDAALADPLTGYFCVGPCWPTPTKPGRAAPGLGLVQYAAKAAPPDDPAAPPWFAIGGIDLDTLDQVLAAGARRVVVVRAITQAPDPAAAAAELAARVRSAG
jgi:thiamine-phosphate pyrophosphorylase